MAEIPILIGDSYAIGRRLWQFEFVDSLGGPYDLSGCTLKTTYKTSFIPYDEDPIDAMALIKHYIIVGDNGGVTANNGLFLVTTAAAGVVHERLTSTESVLLPPETKVYGDIRLTDVRGENFTFPFVDTIKGIQTITNRSSV